MRDRAQHARTGGDAERGAQGGAVAGRVVIAVDARNPSSVWITRRTPARRAAGTASIAPQL